MNVFSHSKPLRAACCGAGILFFSARLFGAPDSGIIDSPSVAGLRARAVSTNVELTWPSDPREGFVVLGRPKPDYKSPWIVLTNQLRAPSNASQTTFLDIGGLNRLQDDSETNLAEFYAVYVIPDFWFDMQGVTLSGGQSTPGADFLPFYYGNKETGIFEPQVELFVDGEDDPEDSGDQEIQHVNFGTSDNPRWAYSTGIHFRHDRYTNGDHILQLHTLLMLNNFIGQWSQELMLSNQPVLVHITNEITFAGFPLFIGRSNATLIAQSANPRVNWRIDVYDDQERRLTNKDGTTTNGEIQWIWDLRDARGQLRDTDVDLKPRITTWPLDGSSKSGTFPAKQNVRNFSSLTATESKIPAKDYPLENQLHSRPWGFLHQPTDKDSSNSGDFVLQLDLSQEFIQITPAYSNAVLKVLLPYFSDVAEKLDLPVSHPITSADVADCRILPYHNKNGEIPNASITTKEGFWFDFKFGYVNGFSWPNSYSEMNGLQGISNFLGTIKITPKQAIQVARDTLKKLGIPLEDVFAEQKPQVRLPTWGTNTIARYLIKWRDPRGGENSPAIMEAEINAETGRSESLYSLALNLKKPSPKVDVTQPRGHGIFDSRIPPAMNPEYAWKLIPIMLQAINEYAQKLSLPVPRPLNTNNIALVEAYNNEGWPHCEITLANGWRFVYRHCMVNGYYAPDNFFNSDNRKIHISDFAGKWNLTTNQAIESVRRAMRKLNYPTNNVHMDFAPRVYTAAVDKEHIPRLRFEWYYKTNSELQSRLEAEVNTDTGALESLYYDDKSYWDCRPPIDAPISVSQKPQANTTAVQQPRKMSEKPSKPRADWTVLPTNARK